MGGTRHFYAKISNRFRKNILIFLKRRNEIRICKSALHAIRHYPKREVPEVPASFVSAYSRSIELTKTYHSLLSGAISMPVSIAMTSSTTLSTSLIAFFSFWLRPEHAQRKTTVKIYFIIISVL